MLTSGIISIICIAAALLDAASSQKVQPIPTPPSLIESLSATTLYFSPNPGATLTFPCVAKGQPKPDYEWRVNGEILSDNPQHDGTLVYQSPDSIIPGYYQCTASNRLGSVKSNLTLVLKAQQASFEQTAPVQRTAVVGQKLVLLCQPRKNSVPTPKETFYSKWYSWRYDDKSSFPLGRRAFIDDSGNLNIAYVTTTDNRPNSELSCFITNPISNIDVGGSKVKLTVRDDGTASATRPAIMAYTNQTQNVGSISTTVVALEGHNVSLRCFFSGSDGISVTWTKKDDQIPTDGRVEQLAAGIELYIKNVQQSDDGSYNCIGSGIAGSTEFLVNLIVRATPVFKTAGDGPRDINATVGEEVKFSCQPYANPEATVRWFKNGIALDPEDSTLYNRFRWTNNNRVLTVAKVCKNNCTALDNAPMVIQCNASNQYGYTYANGYINVFVRTVLTSEPQSAVGRVGDSFGFNVSATSDPNTPITYSWYFRQSDESDEHQLVTTNDHKIVISDDGKFLNISSADESNFGSYRVVASNGISQHSATFDLTPTPVVANIWPAIIILLILLLMIVCIFAVGCFIYQNRGEDYPVDETERKQGNNPEQDLEDTGFQPFQRKDTGSDAGSTISRSSLERLDKRIDEETGLIRERSGSMGGTFH